MNTNSMINEKRFFEEVAANLFPATVILEEIIENSQRADAKKLMITTNMETNIVTFKNNGDILTDFNSIFVVAKSDYSDKIKEEQKPAGMGILSLLGNSHTVTFSSGYNSIEVDCEKYFKDSEYRMNLSSFTKNCVFIDGFMIEAELKENLHISNNSRLAYYNIDIEINGKAVERRELKTYFNEEIEKGVRLIIPSSKINHESYLDDISSSYVLWHGKLIKSTAFYPFSLVVEGNTNLVTPVLPDRSSIKENPSELKKLKEDLEMKYKKEIQVAISKIYESKHLQKILTGLTASYNIDHIDNYYGIKRNSSKKLLMNDKLTLYINGVDDVNYLNYSHLEYCENICNSFDIVRTMKIGNSNAPKWLIEKMEKDINIEIEISEKASTASSYTTHREIFYLCESIKINGVTVNILPLDDGKVYFTKDFDYLEYSEKMSSFYAWEHQPYDEAGTELIEDFDSILNYYNGNLTIDSKGIFTHALRSIGMVKENKYHLDYDKFESITIKKDSEKDSFKVVIKIEEKEQEFKFFF